MTVRAGREFLAIPGPTNMPDEVLRAMHRPALDIYSDTMVNLTEGLLGDLGRLFATKGRPYIYIANGHGAWEATLSNVLSRGDKILVLESGRFAIGWGNFATLMGVDVEILKGHWRRAVRPDEVEARLREDKDHKIKAVLVVLFFMQVKMGTRLTWVWAAIGFLWLIFLFGTLGDYVTRNWISVTGF